MAKFSEVVQGEDARKPYVVPGLKDAHGQPVTVDVVILPGDQEADVNGFAREFSLSKKGTGGSGDPNYELGAMVATLARSILDHDVKDKREPFFPDEHAILRARQLGNDGIAHLFEVQKSWQREISPGLEKTTPSEFMTVALEVARLNDPGPFCRLRLSTQMSFVLFTSSLLATLLKSKSLFGTPYETTLDDLKSSGERSEAET